RLKQLCFSRYVQCAGRFIQNQQRRTMVKRARKTDALPLAAGKSDTTFPDVRVETIAQFRFNNVEYLRHVASFAQARSIHLIVRQANCDIARDRIVDEKYVLSHITEQILPRALYHMCKGPAITQYLAGR